MIVNNPTLCTHVPAGRTVLSGHMEWHRLLKKRLRELRITYASLADELGVTEAAVGHWLTGRREPPLEAVRLMAERAGMSLDELFQDASKYLVVDEREIQLLQALRKLPTQEQVTVARMIDGMAPGHAISPLPFKKPR